jgi:hypothetical protein
MSDRGGPPSAGMSTDVMIRLLGVREASEPLPPEEARLLEAALDGQGSSGGMFVRGVSQGGSPFLNFLTRTFGVLVVLALLLLVGLVFYGVRAVRSLREAPVAAGEMVCRPQLRNAQQAGVLAQVSPILDGKASLPRDSTSLRAAQGRTLMQGADRVDVFSPSGAQMAVQYVGEGPQIRRLSVKFDESQSVCAAMERTGFVSGRRTRVGDSGETLHVASDGPFLTRGGVVRAQRDGDLVALLQFEPR